MSIESLELDNEKQKLKKTKIWLNDKLDEINHNKIKLEEKLSELKKHTKGHNVELEINTKLYNNALKNYNKYKEANIEPYFSRIDFKENNKNKESIYIGKFGLYDDKIEEEKVVDWRSPIADLYYSGTEGKVSYTAPMGEIEGELLLKRKFLFEDSELIDAFDEGINQIILNSGGSSENNLIDEFLKINLEKNVGNRLKDVVATIQKEQNDIIRADLSKPIIVQGSAGSGKTTVAMHRLAYLLYRYKNKIMGNDVLVIAPNELFLDYISEILPGLGVDEVKQTTFEEFSLKFLKLNKKKIYTKDKKLRDILQCSESNEKNLILNTSKLKGSLIYKVIIDRYVRCLEKSDCSIEDLKFSDYIIFEKSFIKKLYLKDLKHLPLNKRKEEIRRYLNGRVKEKVRYVQDMIDTDYSDKINEIKKENTHEEDKRKKIIEAYDKRDIEKEAVKEGVKATIKKFCNKWEECDLLKLYYNFIEDKEIFDLVTANKVPKVLYYHMINEVKNNVDNNIIDSDDLAALMYLKIKLYGINNKFKHIVMDEAQDYSCFQVDVIKDFTLNNSMTIVGDIGQGIYYYKGINEWDKVIKDIFEDEINYVALTQSYRSTVEIIELANQVLKKQNNNLNPAMPVLRHGNKPQFIKFHKDEDFSQKLDPIVDKLKDLGKHNICVIGKDIEECNHIYNSLNKFSKYSWSLLNEDEKNMTNGNMIIPSYMTKGLEFDCSIIYNCNNENYNNTQINKKLLYVVLTRALHFQYIFYNGEISSIFQNISANLA